MLIHWSDNYDNARAKQYRDRVWRQEDTPISEPKPHILKASAEFRWRFLVWHRWMMGCPNDPR